MGDSRFTGLLDAERRHRSAPDSFSIPRSEVREGLGAGDLAKLLFGFGEGDPPPAERMWVEVVELRDGGYVGRLGNAPQAISDLEPGALIPFGPQHVAAIWRDAEHAPRPEQFAFVSDRVWLHDGRPVRAHRMSPANDSFSGWMVFGPSDVAPPPADLRGFSPVSHQALTELQPASDGHRRG
jgi:hypothetical protein